ncbi:MAG: flagellar motor switch protein FliG [Bacteroidota bacterium]
MSTPPLTGAQRAAVLLVSLGVETASQLLAELSDDEVAQVTVEVARLQSVPGAAVEAVLAQYRTAASVPTPATAQGGLETARSILGGLDGERAKAILPRVEAATEGTGFDLLASVDADRLAAFLGGEHPQTAAVVLSRVKARQAADVLALLPDVVRADVVRRLTSLAEPSPDVLRDLDAALRTAFGASDTEVGPSGAKRAADILTQASRETGRAILETLQAQNPDLATEIEDLLFVFDDLASLSDRDLARVLAGVDQTALAKALRGADEAFRERCFANVSERVSASLREEIELSGPMKVADVEDAQRTVVEVTLSLAEKGDITLGAPEAEDAAEVI